jgi:hypothetical protein
MGEKVPITQVEMHVTHVCNFTCDGCSHFSQEIYSGRETVDSFRNSLQPWARWLEPKHFLVLGGEPTLNPELSEILEVARELMPTVNLMLVTNGWFLYKHRRLPGVLKKNRIHLDVSIHHDSPEYLSKLEEIKALASEWGIPIRWRESFRDWVRYYRGVGADAKPFNDSNPRSSWEHCDSRWCLTIHEGKLWKCPPIAYLPMHVRKYGDPDGRWDAYLRYVPLEPNCTLSQLKHFVERKCEAICSMCPANPTPYKKPSPLVRLELKKP